MRATDQWMQRPSSRRQRALRALGEMKGYALPRWQKRLSIAIVGDIDVADSRGRVVRSLDVECRILGNPHVDDISVVIDLGGRRRDGCAQNLSCTAGSSGDGHDDGARILLLTATIILLAGAWREAAPRTKLFLLHNIANQHEMADGRARAHAKAAQQCEATDAMLARFSAERTKTQGGTVGARNARTRAIRRSIERAISGWFIVGAGRRSSMPAGGMRGRQQRETRARRAAARAPRLRALQCLVSGESCPTWENRRRK